MTQLHRQGFTAFFVLATSVLLDICGAFAPASAQVTTNLLTVDGVSLSDAGSRIDNVAVIHDDDATTTTRITVESGKPFDLIFDFGEQVVTVNQLSVMSKSLAADQANIEVLASTLSPTAGFQSLRVEPLKKSAKFPQSFSFEPSAARWIMVRITMANKEIDNATFAVSELGLRGYVGEPKSTYAFDESPADAIKVLARLSDSIAINLSKAEELLFKDAGDGSLDDISYAEASLLSCGITDKQRREKMLKQIDLMQAEVEKAIPSSAAPFERGQQLLAWLHAGPLANGYVEQQTEVSGVLENQTFNCVSSATLYAILARRMNLDVRGIEVPDHAFAILYDGTEHADIETTNKLGFNPARNRQAQERLRQTTGFIYIPDSNRSKRREIGETGMVALTYYNHGVTELHAKRYTESLVNFFKALSLDPKNKSAVKNILSTLGNWSGQLYDAGEVEKSLTVLEVGRELAPEDRKLKHNQKAIWQMHIKQLVSDGKSKDALSKLAAAYARTKDDELAGLQSWVFIQGGEVLVKDNAWQAALASADEGLASEHESVRKEVAKWRASVLLRWSTNLIKDKKYSEAADVLEQGTPDDHSSHLVDQRVAYVVQEWAREVHEKDGIEAGHELVHQLAQRFTDNWRLNKVVNSFTDRAASKFIKAKEFERALEVYVAARTIDPDNYHFKRNEEAVWNMLTTPHLDSKAWMSVVDVCGRGLKSLPNANSLQQNLAYASHQAALEIEQEKGVVVAEKRIHEIAARFPKVYKLQELKGKLITRELNKRIEAEQYDEAHGLISQNQSLWKDSLKLHNAANYLYYQQAKPLMDKEQWSEAIEIFAKGYEAFPRAYKVKNNLEFAILSAAKPLLDNEKWEDAQMVYEKGLKNLPNSTKLKQNIRFCKSKLEE